MSPRYRKSAGFEAAIEAAFVFAGVSLLAPSPTATTSGSVGCVQAGFGRKLCQSLGACWKFETLPFARVTDSVTGVLDVELAYTRSTPDASRYFCVGQTNV